MTVLVVGSDGTGLHPLNGGAPISLNPVFWSPDGKFVVAYGVDLSEIHQYPADGSAADGLLAEMSAPTMVGSPKTAANFYDRASWQRLAP